MPWRRYYLHLGIVCLHVVSNVTINQVIDVRYITFKMPWRLYVRHLGIAWFYVVDNITIQQQIDVGYNHFKCHVDGTSVPLGVVAVSLLRKSRFNKKSTLVISLQNTVATVRATLMYCSLYRFFENHNLPRNRRWLYHFKMPWWQYDPHFYRYCLPFLGCC